MGFAEGMVMWGPLVQVPVTYHEEDGRWWAESTLMPGFTAGGDSLDEVQQLVRDGIPFYLGLRLDQVRLDEYVPYFSVTVRSNNTL